MTTTTIDCQTCPVRGRHCGDCFVPVLGRLWLEDPAPRPERSAPGEEESRTVLAGAPLDSDELAAVSAFVRAGLVDPEEASTARARLTTTGRYAAG
ncbi:hypothetical protein [Ornithinimicrobium pekingense]|uniref:Uncharacterized protein n=1 Tax=Ornithinimicrobium pekingense TaxID=384677 RepID=A0ABQ2F7G2_9MICO|nr:hypothetical protein [Ornithinimicrobium pekingense]GGK69375.1 hypothetical protein GCM10011509_17210 [Ornithinimicrobium pekingense]